jgi:hypothetical protein
MTLEDMNQRVLTLLFALYVLFPLILIGVSCLLVFFGVVDGACMPFVLALYVFGFVSNLAGMSYSENAGACGGEWKKGLKTQLKE